MSLRSLSEGETRAPPTAPDTSGRRPQTGRHDGRETLRGFLAELTALRKRLKEAQRDIFPPLDDDLENLREALRTAAADLRHARAALSWQIGGGEVRAALAVEMAKADPVDGGRGMDASHRASVSVSAREAHRASGRATPAATSPSTVAPTAGLTER